MVDLPWILHHLSVEQLNHFQLLNFEWNQTKKSLFLSIFFFLVQNEQFFCVVRQRMCSQAKGIRFRGRWLIVFGCGTGWYMQSMHVNQPKFHASAFSFFIESTSFSIPFFVFYFFLVLFWMPVIRWLTFFRQINRGKRGAEGTKAVNLNLWQNAWTNPSASIYLLWKYGIMVMMMKMVIHLPHRMVDWL